MAIRDDKWGYALGAGIKLFAPSIGPGDYFQSQVNYTVGASKYTNNADTGSYTMYRWQQLRLWRVDGCRLRRYRRLLADPTDLQLTTTWNVNAAYEHFWNKQWRTSLWGSYMEVSYNGSANAHALH